MPFSPEQTSAIPVLQRTGTSLLLEQRPDCLENAGILWCEHRAYFGQLLPRLANATGGNRPNNNQESVGCVLAAGMMVATRPLSGLTT
jgi:hypothetical protein